MEGSVAMPSGRVKWFNTSKGYGFVLADAEVLADGRAAEGAGEDLFVHYSSIQMDGYRSLKAGEAVAFDLQRADRGYHAVNVRRIGAETDAVAAHVTASDTRAEIVAEASTSSTSS